jgi:hypothetical protein
MININHIIRKNLLKEEKFHELKKEISFSFDIYHDYGGHTQGRKWRHGSGNKIYDLDIVRLLKSGLDEIIYNIIDGNIRNSRRFILSREGGDNLNLVISPEKLESNKWNLVIITVMKKQDFTVGAGQLQIFV